MAPQLLSCQARATEIFRLPPEHDSQWPRLRFWVSVWLFKLRDCGRFAPVSTQVRAPYISRTPNFEIIVIRFHLSTSGGHIHLATQVAAWWSINIHGTSIVDHSYPFQFRVLWYTVSSTIRMQGTLKSWRRYGNGDSCGSNFPWPDLGWVMLAVVGA